MKPYILIFICFTILFFACKKTNDEKVNTAYTVKYSLVDSSYGVNFDYYDTSIHNIRTVKNDTTYLIGGIVNVIVDINKHIIYKSDTFTYNINGVYGLPNSFGFDFSSVSITNDSIFIGHESLRLNRFTYYSTVRGYRVP